MHGVAEIPRVNNAKVLELRMGFVFYPPPLVGGGRGREC